jgi:hypothetical protein
MSPQNRIYDPLVILFPIFFLCLLSIDEHGHARGEARKGSGAEGHGHDSRWEGPGPEEASARRGITKEVDREGKEPGARPLQRLPTRATQTQREEAGQGGCWGGGIVRVAALCACLGAQPLP